MFSVYYVCSHPTLSVLIFKVWASVTCSVNVSAHYFREWVEISFVGLTGALIWLRKASQSGKNCVRSREDTVLHRSVLIIESLVRFDWSALGPYLYKTQLLQVVSFLRSGHNYYFEVVPIVSSINHQERIEPAKPAREHVTCINSKIQTWRCMLKLVTSIYGVYGGNPSG